MSRVCPKIEVFKVENKIRRRFSNLHKGLLLHKTMTAAAATELDDSETLFWLMTNAAALT